MQDVADLAGVSKATVSNVLNRKNGCGPQVTRRVLDCCEKLGYALDWNLQDMIRLNKNNTAQHIACIMCGVDYGSQVYARFLDGCAAAGDKHNFFVTLCKLSGREERVFDLPPLLRDRRLDGFMLTGILSPEIIGVLRQLELPFVLLGNYADELVDDGMAVETDLSAAFTDILARLDARPGMRILYFEESYEYHYARALRDAFRLGMERRGMVFDPACCFGNDGFLCASYGYFLRWYRQQRPEFDAIVCMDFRSAQNLSSVLLHEMGDAEAARICVATTRTHENMALPVPAVYVNPRFDEMAEAAIDMLVGIVNGTEAADGGRKLLLKPVVELVPDAGCNTPCT